MEQRGDSVSHDLVLSWVETEHVNRDEIFAVTDPGPDGRVSSHEAVPQVEDGHAGRGGVDPEVESVGVVADDVVDKLGPQSWKTGYRV